MTERTISNLTTLIKNYREKKEVSQSALARLLGWKTGQFISNIEHGLSEYPREAIPKVAKHLQIPAEKLWDAYNKDCQLEFKEII